MLSTDSFLYDTIEEEANVDDSANTIPFTPVPHAHIHPHDYFLLKTSNGIECIGEYTSSRHKNVVPMWQQPSSLPCGDHSSDLALFRILTTEANIQQNNYVDAHLLKVPYEDLSKCIGLRQVYLTKCIYMATNTEYTWYRHCNARTSNPEFLLSVRWQGCP